MLSYEADVCWRMLAYADVYCILRACRFSLIYLSNVLGLLLLRYSCFTGTNVLALLLLDCRASEGTQGTIQFTFFTGTKVQILTQLGEQTRTSPLIFCSLLALLVQKYLLHWYTSTHTDAAGGIDKNILTYLSDALVTQFTCFTGTQVLALLVHKYAYWRNGGRRQEHLHLSFGHARFAEVWGFRV